MRHPIAAVESRDKVRDVLTSVGNADGSATEGLNSDALLIQARRGGIPGDGVVDRPDGSPLVDDSVDPQEESPFKLSFRSSSLICIAADRDRHESLSVARSGQLHTRPLLAFCARNRSTWALDVLANKLTRGLHDWSSLSATVRQFGDMPRDFDLTLDRIKLEDLWAISEALHERALDNDSESGLLLFIATRILEGREFADAALEPLMENLLHAGLGDQARALFPQISKDSWLRHSFAIDLEHPRFGGSFDAVLLTLNQVFHRFGLERVALEGTGETPFQRLSAATARPAPVGPLVTVIMTCWNPGPEIFTAVRSIIGQTYQNWELIVTDDASPGDCEPILQQVASLDPRIRVVRNSTNAGTYIRRNEAIQLARGEFVTMQDSDDWSHPRRIEIQMQDLRTVPGRLANVVLAARVTEDFCMIGPRGGRLFVSEPSILFRCEAVIDAVGFFDSTRKGADTEFRQRLELVTGKPVRTVGPEVPIEFMLARSDSLSGEDFSRRLSRFKWISPVRLAYRNSISRFHEQIKAGEHSGMIPFPQEMREFSAPPHMLGSTPAVRRVDVLVVIDGRSDERRSEFLKRVVAEVRLATSEGLSLALLQSDSATGASSIEPLADELELLVDAGQLVRVFDGDELEAAVAVIRHAGAAQGHPAKRKSMSVDSAIVVEDASGGDIRGSTVAKPDVVATVVGWFSVEPSWVVVHPPPPRPTVVSVVGDGKTIQVTLEASDPDRIRAIQLGNAQQFQDLATSVDETGVIKGQGPMSDMPCGELSIVVVRDAEGGQRTHQLCWADPTFVLTKPSERMVIPSDGLLRHVTDASMTEAAGHEFAARQLSARVSCARVSNGEIDLTVEHQSAAVTLTAVNALREVDGRIRVREFTLRELASGDVLAARSLANFVDVRWEIFGTFLTPLGPVNIPITVSDGTRVEDSSRFRIRKLDDGRAGVLHVVPQVGADRQD